MELQFGQGHLIWNTLDLEDYAPADPVATRIAGQLLRYVATAELPTRRPTYVIGVDPAQRQILESTSLIFEDVETLPESGLVVIGRDARLTNEQIESFLASGGSVVFFSPQTDSNLLGAKLTVNPDAGKYAKLPDWPELKTLHGGMLRTRGPVADYLVLADGPELAANGQLGRKQVGQGVAIYFMPASDKLNLPRDSWRIPNHDLRHVRRFTSWRQTQSLTRILTNLGARFELDGGIPRMRAINDSITLSGAWRVNPISLVPGNDDFWKRVPIPEPSEQAVQAAAVDTDDSGWPIVNLPGLWEGLGEQDGEVVFRRNVSIPYEWEGRDLVIRLGKIRDADTLYWNGQPIGSTIGHQPERVYTVPAGKVKAGRNVIAVRVFNNYLAGGFAAEEPGEMLLSLVEGSQRITRVRNGSLGASPFYNANWNPSDCPFRYWRW